VQNILHKVAFFAAAVSILSYGKPLDSYETKINEFMPIFCYFFHGSTTFCVFCRWLRIPGIQWLL